MHQTTYTGPNSPAESKWQVDSTYIFSKIILVKRFFRFWWKFSGKRQRMSSALVKPRYTTCLVRLCKADTSCQEAREGAGLKSITYSTRRAFLARRHSLCCETHTTRTVGIQVRHDSLSRMRLSSSAPSTASVRSLLPGARVAVTAPIPFQ